LLVEARLPLTQLPVPEPGAAPTETQAVN